MLKYKGGFLRHLSAACVTVTQLCSPGVRRRETLPLRASASQKHCVQLLSVVREHRNLRNRELAVTHSHKSGVVKLAQFVPGRKTSVLGF